MTVLFRKLLLAVGFKRCPYGFLPNPLSRRVIITRVIINFSMSPRLWRWTLGRVCSVVEFFICSPLSPPSTSVAFSYTRVWSTQSPSQVSRPFLSNCLVGVASSRLQEYLIGQLYTWTLLSSLQVLLSSPEKVGRWTPFNLTGNALCKDCFLPSFRPFKASLCRRTMT